LYPLSMSDSEGDVGRSDLEGDVGRSDLKGDGDDLAGEGMSG